MAVTHQHLPLEQVRPGMILSDVLLDAHGQVLLPQGAVLTENMLSLMPRHGIAMLPIQAPPPSPEVVAAQQAADSERLAYLFRKLDPDDPEDAATTLLRNYVMQYRLGTGEPA
ncbi:hypothetical protein AKG95_03835 [Janthinobacterium lividum]|jgi:hypothetical protein|uniref:Uncharacterized protein n=1 Tax=Janthinobacterium lividum TaxID=29581 RepID=A0A1S1UF36_9BURK|nr:hypothetical protein [Janthinobacterium lividum]OHV98381.1 hypothetical protein AKG95_03835 [Janthinobacterium lividum]